MRGSEPRMHTTINFVEHLDGFSAQGQESFVRRQGHGSILRAMNLPSTTEATRRRDQCYKTESLASADHSGETALRMGDDMLRSIHDQVKAVHHVRWNFLCAH